MIDEPDFSFPEDGLGPHATSAPHAPEPQTDAIPAPVIVVETVHRGLLTRLTAPLMILFIALAITSYQRKTPVRLVAAGNPAAASAVSIPTDTPAADTTGAQAAPASASPATTLPPGQPLPTAPGAFVSLPPPPLATTEPLVATTDNTAQPAAADVPEKPIATPSPFEIRPDDGLRPLDAEAPATGVQRRTVARPPVAFQPAGPASPPAGANPPQVAAATPPATPVPNALPGVEPLPGPAGNPPATAAGAGEAGAEPTKDAILQDIQREAAEKEAQRQSMEELKPQAARLLLDEAIARINANRKPFRDALRTALKSSAASAGTDIDAACNRFGREMPPEIKVAYNRVLNISTRRMTRQEEVNFMRTCGLPEPVILDFLANKLHRTLKTRGGPRDENEVRIRAAQLLLSYPVVTPHTAQGPEPHN